MPEQLQLFASLDFPGRTTVQLWEIADRLNWTVRHLLNLVDSGDLVALDGACTGAGRRSLRVPIECYRAFILKRLTGPADVRMQFLQQLPAPVRHQLIADLKASLRAL